MSQLYFAQVASDGPIKIGVTSWPPAERVAALQCGCPWPINLIGSVDGTVAQEYWLHNRLSDHRLLGEWFSPHPDVLTAMNDAIAGIYAWGDITPPREPSDLSEFILRVRRDFGGGPELAKTCGVGPSTANAWIMRRSIPFRYWTILSDTAKQRGLDYITLRSLYEIHYGVSLPDDAWEEEVAA